MIYAILPRVQDTGVWIAHYVEVSFGMPAHGWNLGLYGEGCYHGDPLSMRVPDPSTAGRRDWGGKGGLGTEGGPFVPSPGASLTHSTTG